MSGLAFFEESHRTALFEGLMRAFVKFVAPQTTWRVLDLGCGAGGTRAHRRRVRRTRRRHRL